MNVLPCVWLYVKFFLTSQLPSYFREQVVCGYLKVGGGSEIGRTSSLCYLQINLSENHDPSRPMIWLAQVNGKILGS